MGLSKRQIITAAFSELGLAAYAFDLQPEDLQEALEKLDAMMATWGGRGIRIGYSGGNGAGDIDLPTEVPAWADEAMYLGLALRIAPSHGKTPSLETKLAAQQSFMTVLNKVSQPRVRSLSGYAGNGVQIIAKPEGLQTGNDGLLDLGSAG